jgi:hypothetical protein
VQHDDVCSNQLRHLPMQLHLLNRGLHHRLPLGVEHHELIGMQAEPDVIRLRQGSRIRQCAGNPARRIEPIQGVAAEWVSGERKKLAGDAECADAELMTPLHGFSQGDGVVVCDVRQVAAPVSRRQSADVAMSCCPELDWRVEKLAAEAPSEAHSNLTICSPTK